ncbi:NHL repeat-containing protein 2 isoform X1 [Nilaparvata lugens]|uniref:NHL repeat-containing protein 2 isoform X1 n=1 Tax=Nilaparvata lugens TaxID=108931 RepID=UPI00193E22E4|nr:NHL repeat-containing protein 2 isoform X1 [Nilaparvata lugens]
MAYDFHDFQECLLERLSKESGDSEKRDAINKYLKDGYNLERKSVPEFENGLEWINVTEPLRLNLHLKGKIVLLDFFTYCCINCMHILPDLKALEHLYSVEDGLVVVGVHSPKFSNEKETANVAAAVARYEIAHAVVSDPTESMWQALNVCCWPTLVVLGPRGEPLLELRGEGHRKLLELFIGEAITFFAGKNELSPHKIEQISVNKQVESAGSPLRFPGKVAVFDNMVAIADTGHHRVIVANKSGQIQHIIGGSEPGYSDGAFREARFNACQGLAFKSADLLYVADTDNHTIREVDLSAKLVRTVAGIAGDQGSDRVGGALGPQQPISSPWDVCLLAEGKLLLIAMAGTHQLWALFLDDTVWWKNKSYAKGVCVCVAGSGREENTNNLYPMSAAFAQPSGVVLAAHAQCVFVADSESSTVRRLQLADGRVQAVVGATLDRKNLFSFGDVDGKGMDAKLQHPLGVAWCARTSTVYVADSYNHKLKSIDANTNVCTTYTHIDPAYKLNEPGGLCVDGDDLYIADTNNHRVLVVDTVNKTTRKFDLKMTSDLPKNLPAMVEERSVRVASKEGSRLVLRIKIAAPTGSSFPSEKMIRWEMHPPTDGRKVDILDSKLEGSSAEWQVSTGGDLLEMLLVACSAPICSGQTCSAWKGTFKINITSDNESQSTTESTVCDIVHTINLQ